MNTHFNQTPPAMPFAYAPSRLPRPALQLRLPRPEKQGLSRRELQALVAEMLG